MDMRYARQLNQTVYSAAAELASSFYNFDTATYLQGDNYDFPSTEEPIWILGSQYSALHELDELREDYTSRIWITYRKGFPAIGGNGPTSDQGWGCMLRCGQMIMAQGLIHRHLGRDWRWKDAKAKVGKDAEDEFDEDWHPLPPLIQEQPHVDMQLQQQQQQLKVEKDHERYLNILCHFQDKKKCLYSIHQIAMMGASDQDKAIGQWFGPNTIAQALKKLSAYDHDNDVTVHVAMDNVVIISDVKKLCVKHSDKPVDEITKLITDVVVAQDDKQEVGVEDCHTQSVAVGTNNVGEDDKISEILKDSKKKSKSKKWYKKYIKADRKSANSSANDDQGTCSKDTVDIMDETLETDRKAPEEPETGESSHKEEKLESKRKWKPLILFIPLRLGLNEINPIYFKQLKTVFRFKQTLGIIGGKPNHALYMIGTVGNEMIYLDPHTTQPVVDLDDKPEDNANCNGATVDDSYHCKRAARAQIEHMDPSIALGFYLKDEQDFDNWCRNVQRVLLYDEKQPLFELIETAPKKWGEMEDELIQSTGPQSDDDEEFELLG